jgi:hypothetical protein
VTREHRAPILATVLVAMALPFLMPDRFSPGPSWLLPSAEAGLLVAVAVTDPGRIDRRSRDVRGVRIALIVVLVAGAAWATVRLTIDLIHGGPDTDAAGPLLAAGGLVWVDLVIVFALLYWELDAGGPGRRGHGASRYPDLAFPQHLSPALARPNWQPVFYDYLYLGLTNAIAFSPTDVMPLAHWAKLAMGLESLTSIAILGLVIARAVNVLG